MGTSEPNRVAWLEGLPEELKYELNAKDNKIACLQRERDEANKRSEYWKAEHLAGNEEVERLTRERDEAVRVAVWAAKHEAEVLPAKMGLPAMLSWNSRVGVKFPIQYRQLPLTDGTDESIYHALREASGGEDR